MTSTTTTLALARPLPPPHHREHRYFPRRCCLATSCCFGKYEAAVGARSLCYLDFICNIAAIFFFLLMG